MTENTVKALPQISTLQLTPGDRAMGRLASINLPDAPEGDAQADLAGDIFFEMFQSSPTAREEVPEERGVNRSLLDWMGSTHGWGEARTSTIANMPASMAASGLMWAHLQTDEVLKEALNQQEEASQKTAEAKAKQMAADAMAQSSNREMQRQAGQVQAEADQLRQEAAAAAAAAQAIVEDAQGKPFKQAAMMAAAKEASKEAGETAEAMAGWGLGPGSHIYSDPKAAQDFLAANQGKIARIARLAGRMRGFALQSRKERVPMGFVPTEVGLTQDLMRLFPTELFLLRPDAPAFLRVGKVTQFMEAGLLGYKPVGDAEKRGPFVAAVDVSPSMRVGDREIVAKAVALGVAQVAKQEGRPYVLFAFGSDKRLMTAVTSKDDWSAHLNWTANSQNGGTDFDMALTEVMRHLVEMGKDSKGADALFISDGEAGVGQGTRSDWRDFAAQTGARLLYVPVAKSYYTDMEDTADKVIHVADLDEDAGEELAGELGRIL
jgi:uncharacterized protein with von Willebrand factor type A (vWA) domain